MLARNRGLRGGQDTQNCLEFADGLCTLHQILHGISHIDAEFYCQHVKQILDDLKCTTPLCEFEHFSPCRTEQLSKSLILCPNVNTMCVIRQSVQSAICSSKSVPWYEPSPRYCRHSFINTSMFHRIWYISNAFTNFMWVSVVTIASQFLFLPTLMKKIFTHVSPIITRCSKYMHLYLRHTTASRSCRAMSSWTL